MKLKWNLNQTETSLLENITNMGESNNREKTAQNNQWFAEDFLKSLCTVQQRKLDLIKVLRKKEIFLQ